MIESVYNYLCGENYIYEVNLFAITQELCVQLDYPLEGEKNCECAKRLFFGFSFLLRFQINGRRCVVSVFNQLLSKEKFDYIMCTKLPLCIANYLTVL